MSAMMFSYVKARQIEIELEVERRRLASTTPSMRDRLGRTLIGLGEQLIALPQNRSGSNYLAANRSNARQSIRPAA